MKMQSDMITQIIDYDGNIIGDLKAWMCRNKLSNLGFDYNVIAILGSQSSGKSTLLNHLFKTCFDVMNTKQGHSQTTKGLWLSYEMFQEDSCVVNTNNIENKIYNDTNYPNNENKREKNEITPTLILDVEGTDSKERGDNRLTFEHRSALFCLALADCVIVNLWYHSLGNFTASNYGLLKTVMEVNLELFQQDKNCPKTILLFAVRDWFEDFASIEIVKSKIIEDYLNKIWKEMKKPNELESINISNFFIIEVVGLSHAIIKKEEFIKDVNNLRKKWINELKPLQYSRNIPSDGFAQYCNNIWNTIVKQSQLDIPSQKEMLATFRCQEIKNNVINNINKTIKEKIELSHNKPIDNFKEWAENEVIEKCLNEYLSDASRYKESICLKTSEELLENLYIQLQLIVDNNLNFVQRELSVKFFNELNNLYKVCSTDKSIFLFDKESYLNTKEGNHFSQKERNEENHNCIYLWANFLHNSDILEYQTLCNFFENYEKCNIEIKKKTIHEFNYKSSLNTLFTSIYKDVNRIKNIQYNLLLDKVRSTIKSRFKSIDTLLIISKNTEEYWNAILNIVTKLQENINTNLTKCFINLKNNELSKIYFYDENDKKSEIYNNEKREKLYLSLSNKENNYDKNLYNTKKINTIKNKEKYISVVNEEVNKQMENIDFMNDLKKFYLEEIIDVLKNNFIEISENLSRILIQRFELVFNYDEAEQPRQWKDISMLELKKLFRESKNYAFLIIEILQKNIKVEIIDDYLPNNIIKEEVIEKGKIKAKKKMQELCRDAQYIQETGGKMSLKNIPLLFWVILLLFGWNEILSFTRFFFKLNIIIPFILAFILIISTCVYNGNIEALSYINKIFFYVAKNSYNFYKHIQKVNDKSTKEDESD
ncbi:root hair defective 3 GTP-binding protein (RHD3) homolog, putative [Plasmodium gallinaceum]|uniref:Protein SEY1 homolog n=1 Tax=Plasmodium gallinaceum TaxID=5849 RepID=A0A1J1GXE1_PLAGA|nr:root hair defective 3 GTP-binding protein (RHD3) homolog, putative [Plasmodium gallinaceum]CRG95680.1 root hair defective 3 GTP-binding protein (RHD3) homolog, putative [Plasmodium gallinaceum]